MFEIQKLGWDSDFLGYNVGLIEILNDDPDFELKNYNCKDFSLIFVYKLSGLKFPRSNNNSLVDVKYRYAISLNEINHKIDILHNIEKYVDSEATKELIHLCIASGEYSRFKLDSNFDESVYPELFKRWMINALKRTKNEEIFVSKIGDFIVGLLILSFNKDKATIEIISVDKSHQGKGIASSLIDYAFKESKMKNCSQVYVSTQQKNLPSCALYESKGFKLQFATDIFHFWI